MCNGDLQASSPAVDCHSANAGKDCANPPVHCTNSMCEIANGVDSVGADCLCGDAPNPCDMVRPRECAGGHDS